MPELPIEPRRELIFITCPLCGMNRILFKTGRLAERLANRPLKPKQPRRAISGVKGRIRFDHVDLGSGLIVQVRDPSGGRRDGLRLVRGLTFQEFQQLSEYSDLREQIKEQCRKITAILI